MWRIKEFIVSVKNLIRWFPIIWKDRDWDTNFIWDIFKFKIENQAKYIGYHDRHLSAKRDAEIMMLCVRLMEKIRNEYYQAEYQEYSESEIVFSPSSKEGYSEINIVEKHENYDEYFKKYPRIYKQVMESKKNRFHTDEKVGIALNIAHINHDRARKLLFTLMERNIEGWWD